MFMGCGLALKRPFSLATNSSVVQGRSRWAGLRLRISSKRVFLPIPRRAGRSCVVASMQMDYQSAMAQDSALRVGVGVGSSST